MIETYAMECYINYVNFYESFVYFHCLPLMQYKLIN